MATDDVASWYTLGVVHYAAGRWNAARIAVEKSLKIQPEGSVSRLFLLAMTQWQLGDRPAAQRRYQQAVDWMQKDGPANKELRHLHAEAAELLGVKYTPPVVAVDQDEPAEQEVP